MQPFVEISFCTLVFYCASALAPHFGEGTRLTVLGKSKKDPKKWKNIVSEHLCRETTLWQFLSDVRKTQKGSSYTAV